MWVLLVLSVVALAVIIERSVVYLWFGLRPGAWLDAQQRLLRENQVARVVENARQSRHPVARVVEAYLSNLPRPHKLRMDVVKQVGSHALEKVEARLRILAAIAHLSPLIGLLGTVVGMVVAFARIQALQGTVKPADLAGGIWEALLTTVFGLMVAIPCMAAFHAFESHSDRISRRMQLAVTAMEDALNVTETFQPEGGNAAAEEEWSTVG